MTDALRMKKLRQRRKETGLKKISFWVREEDEEKARGVVKSFQALALAKEKKSSLESLSEALKAKLEEFGSWERYMMEKYDFTFEPSTEKQRKYALRLSLAFDEEIPKKIFLHKGLLKSWIKDKLNKK